MLVRNATPSVDERIKYMDGEMPTRGMEKMRRSQWLRKVYSEYDDRMGITASTRRSEVENHKFYTGLEFGQWSQDVISKSTMKNLAQFNFVQKQVNGVVGNLVRNWWDIDFVSTDGTGSDDLSIIKDLYFSDKEICDWDIEFSSFLKNGVIRSAEMLMYVDYRHDPNFGNIAIKALTPGTVLRDVNWVSSNSGDCKNAYVVSYMTPSEMMETYPDKAQRIKTMISMKEMESNSSQPVFDNKRDAVPRINQTESYNATYKIIEYHHMVTEEHEHSFGLSHNGQFMAIPNDATDEWLESHGIEANSIIKEKKNTAVYYVTTFCPELDIYEPLEDKPGRLQIGRLPIFHWSFNRHNGKDIGLVDILKDPQTYFNEMMSLTHSIIKHTRRTKIIDPEAFGDIANLDDLRTKILKGDEVVFTEPGASRLFPNMIQEGSPSTPMGQEMNFAQMVMAQTERLTPVTSAMEGVQGNERSALQFDMKREQGEVNMTLLQNSVKLFLNELAEGYFYAAQALYGGMYRKFSSPLGTVEINIPMEDGRILNDITALPRAKVVVTESPASISRRTSDRVISMQILQMLGDDVVARNTALDAIFSSLESIPESKKQIIKQNLALSTEVAINAMALQNSQIELQLLQSEGQKNQMMNPEMGNPADDEQMMLEQVAAEQGGAEAGMME
jgi:hypothetical protein